ncbi:O-succinylhomoserine sulfhydrylase [Hansschlegelia zhihuaiae]|uniref:O-succinylhomoserine sulfhydrylase n=1 Tax=Hansschlegelia zhihuaiae TaxID=405005 RepID=A0A4V1KHV9_9HYPH|nr:O-succinylhomoserine sulfhydrylase [Hansschlegelia zhihuaiae]RXF68552.1 O-succinylhomoserine sulfhydrylase [Hansschlegelia zhihuaiae]
MSRASLPKSRDLSDATRLIHEGEARSGFGEMSEPIYVTSGYAYETMEAAEARFDGRDPGYIYSRFSNPTVTTFERRMMALEGAEAARATASGMAAVTAAMLCQIKAGDHVVSAKALFGSCRYVVEDLLPRFGVPSTLVDGADLDQWRSAVRPETRVFFLESPTNPTLEVYDIEAIAKIAHEAGALLVVDNVFATPVLQKPLKFGADVVVYSATKHIDGQGRTLGGVVLGSEKFVMDHLHTFMRQTGPSMSPFNAWVLAKGLETLSLRVERMQASAAKVADFLASHPKVKKLTYCGRDDHPQAALVKKQMTGGGTLATFDIGGAKPEAFRFGNALEIVKISNNLGDAKSILTHPATTTHQRLAPDARAELGITDATLRLSVGLEDVDDLIEDIDTALKAV